METFQQHKSHEAAIFSLWLNWVIAGGALVLPSLVSVYVPALFVPLLTFTLAIGLFFYDRASLRDRSAVCPLIPDITVRTLALSGVIMVLIALSYSRGIIYRFYDSELLNVKIPFLTSLIISPVGLLFALIALFRGTRYTACRTCVLRLGVISERGFIGKLFQQESRYQLYFLTAIAGVMTLLSWGYYLSFYINVNLNVPDKFFLGWVPTIAYLISIAYLALRYFNIWAYYYQNFEHRDSNMQAATTVRYLVLLDNTIYLSRNDEFSGVPDASLFDTPATISYKRASEISKQYAREVFRDISRLPMSDFEIRFIYYSEETLGARNVFHYIAVPKDREVMNKSAFKGKWYNLSQLERMLHNHELSPALAAEINRLYTVTMAWKTYDAEGKRLYKVKNYHPVFRLNGIADWDVDFNSEKWLQVANLNQDKPFYRIRHFWHKLTNGRNEPLLITPSSSSLVLRLRARPAEPLTSHAPSAARSSAPIRDRSTAAWTSAPARTSRNMATCPIISSTSAPRATSTTSSNFCATMSRPGPTS